MTASLLVVITVDTETPQSLLLSGQRKTDMLDPVYMGKGIGYSLVLEELKRFGIRGVFFVSAYEAALWGEEVLQAVCERIVSEGHEVGLHTHPAWRYDRTRPDMWQYSAAEQKQIIAEGLAMLRRWLPGYQIIAHRAGNYGLNTDTLEALRSNGIAIDSSMFYGHPKCKVLWSKNRPIIQDGLLEIPVTGFFRQCHIKLGLLPLRQTTAFIKTDLDWASLDELTYFVRWATAHDVGIMNFFLHSFSFVRFRKGSATMRRDEGKVLKFRRFLEYIASEPDCEVRTMRDLLADGLLSNGPPTIADDPPVFCAVRPAWQEVRDRLPAFRKIFFRSR